MTKFHTSLTAVAASLLLAASANAAKINLSADIVVIGGGAAGMPAAVQAAEKGAKVILLEKNLSVGGGAQFAEGLYGVATKWQREKNYGLSVEEVVKYYDHYHHYLNDSKLNRLFVKGSAENLEWLEKHNINFEVIQVSPNEPMAWHVIGHYKTAEGKDTEHGAAYIAALKDCADKLGVKILTETPAKNLIVKDGKVTGVVAASEDDEYTITAKAVIDAAGGFGNNPDLIREIAHRDPTKLKSSLPLNKTGDVIQMARKLGAETTGATFVTHPGTEGTGIQFLSNLYTMSWQPFNVWVNRHGERFAKETLVFEFAHAGNAIYAQPGGYGWAIFDDAAVEYAMTKGVDSGIGVLIKTTTKMEKLKDEMKAALSANSESFKSAASLAELATKINVPAKALEKTMEKYNLAAKVGFDREFGKESGWTRPIGKGNYYALKMKPYFFISLGGLRTDYDMKVLRSDDSPIQGLWATGAEVGNLYSESYTTWTSGHIFGFAAWSGRRAALDALKTIGK